MFDPRSTRPFSAELLASMSNGGVLKEVLRRGDGRKPENGDYVSVHYTGKIKNTGVVFACSRKEKKIFRFVLCSEKLPFVKGWNLGVQSMCVGERALLTIRSDFGYGDQGCPPNIPGGATLVFDIELLGVENRAKGIHTILCSRKTIERECLDLQRLLSTVKVADGSASNETPFKSYDCIVRLLCSSAALLTPKQFSEVITERAEGFGICGFPLCTNSKPPRREKSQQKYSISLKTFQVYDVSSSFLYCSCHCAAASSSFQNCLSEISSYARSVSERERCYETAKKILLKQGLNKCRVSDGGKNILKHSTSAKDNLKENMVPTKKRIELQVVVNKDGKRLDIASISSALEKSQVVERESPASVSILCNEDHSETLRLSPLQNISQLSNSNNERVQKDDDKKNVAGRVKSYANIGSNGDDDADDALKKAIKNGQLPTQSLSSFGVLYTCLSSWSTDRTMNWTSESGNDYPSPLPPSSSPPPTTTSSLERKNDGKTKLYKKPSVSTIGGHCSVELQRFSALSLALGKSFHRVKSFVQPRENSSFYALQHEFNDFFRTFSLHKPLPSFNTTHWQIVALVILVHIGATLPNEETNSPHKSQSEMFLRLLERAKLDRREFNFLSYAFM
eukprot:g4546.t1